MPAAIFLDRDGTIIVDKHYQHDPGEIEFEKEAIDGLKLLQNAGYKLIIITNQSGVGRGYFSLDQYFEFERHLDTVLASHGINITQTYMCPQSPDEVPNYRKPHPKMLLDAQKDHNIQMEQSFMIGDKEIDVEAGHNAGTQGILLPPGLSSPNEKQFISSSANYIASSLLDAAKNHILK